MLRPPSLLLFLPWLCFGSLPLKGSGEDAGFVINGNDDSVGAGDEGKNRSNDDGGSKAGGDNGRMGGLLYEDHGLLVLNEENFHYALSKHGAILIVLYAPWCDHSVPLVERMADAARILKTWEEEQELRLKYCEEGDNEGSTVPWLLPEQLVRKIRAAPPRLAKIDATMETGLADVFRLQGYPTVKLVLPLERDDKEHFIEGEAGGQSFVDNDPFTVVEYEGDVDKSSASLLSFLFHHWSRHPSPLFGVEDALEMEHFLSWLEHDDILSPVHATFSTSEHTIFVQCREDSSVAASLERSFGDFEERVRASMSHFNSTASANFGWRNTFFVALGADCNALDMSFPGQVRVILTPSSARLVEKEVGGGVRRLLLKNNDFHDNVHDPRTLTSSGETLEEFVSRQSLPLLPLLSRENLSLIFGRGRLVHVCLFVKDDNCSQTLRSGNKVVDLAVSNMEKAALTHRRLGYVFVIVPSAEYRILDYFGILSFPTVLITDMRDGRMKKYYMASQEITDELSVHRFVHAFNEGTLKPVLKSQPVSPEDTRGVVKIVRGESFDSMVMQSGRHSLVNFFAPWCGHSKHLGPKWTDLANLMIALRLEIDVMKMDATENEVDHPRVDIPSFPTIYFFPLGNKTNPLLYDGKRSDAKDFITWLFQHGLRESASGYDATHLG